ncbi:reverse transcriptase [Tanacetum coccineum]
MMILWGLWTKRNKHSHGQVERREDVLEVMAKRILLDYCNANIKLKESGKVGMSFVARNCNGEVLLSRARSEFYAKSPLEVEAKAVWWAIKHAQSRGYFKAVFESDSLTLVHALHNQLIPLQIATLFSDILSKLACIWYL